MRTNVLAISVDLVQKHLKRPLSWMNADVQKRAKRCASASQAIRTYLQEMADLEIRPNKRPRTDMEVEYQRQNLQWQLESHGQHETETVSREGTMEMAASRLSHVR